MKRTLLITDDYAPQTGGVAAYYSAICRLLPGTAITVLTAPMAGAKAYDVAQPYRIVRRPLLSSNAMVWPRWRLALRETNTMIGEMDAEMLWVGQILPYGTVAWIVHRRLGLPYIVTVHGMDIGIPRGRRRWLCQRILNDAHAVVANSLATRTLAVDSYSVNAAKISVQTPGVAAAHHVRQSTVDALRRQFGPDDAGPIVLTVGRLVARKNHHLLLTALPQIISELPRVRCVIVGDGPMRSAIDRYARRLGVRDRVTVLGEISDHELAAWYEAADIFVLTPKPSIHGDQEGFGLVYLEASSYGKPVVATDIAGVHEAVADGVSGLLVEPNNVRALAAAIVRLGRDRALAHRLGIQGQDRAARQFSWKIRAAAYQRVLT